MGVTDGSGNEGYQGVSVDIDTLGDWAKEFARWEPMAARNSDIGECGYKGTSGALPAVKKAGTAHASASTAALELVGALDRLWSGTASGVAAAAVSYSDTDAGNAAVLQRLRRDLVATAKGK
ncbi:MAG: hypothetical protein ACRDT6_21070 [Micromonosporaceae bacterium]